MNAVGVVALAAIPLWLALPCLTGGGYALGDLYLQFWPWKLMGRQALALGHLPLWDPNSFCGAPLLGNLQSGLVYPPHALFYCLGFAPALGLHLLFHSLWMGLGARRLAKALGLSAAPALLMALCWQGNAFMLARVQFPSALAAMAWTPWILAWVVERGGEGERPPLWAGGALVGLQWLAGYPLEGAQAALAAVTLCFAAPRAAKSLAALAAALGLGLCLAAVQALPGLVTVLGSVRGSGLAASATGLAMPPSALLAAFTGALARADWAYAFHPGFVAVGLAALALALAPRDRRLGAALALAALGACACLGLDPLKAIGNRHPSFGLNHLAMAAALLAGLGGQAMEGRLEGRLPGPARHALGLALAGLLLADLMALGPGRPPRVDARLFSPAPGVSELGARLAPRRLLLSPAVQTWRRAQGTDATAAYRCYGAWLQANTAAASGVPDANGYDPLAPAGVVALLNRAAFPAFGADPDSLDLLGVGLLVDWKDAPGGELRLTRRDTALRAVLAPAALAPLLLGDDLAASAKALRGLGPAAACAIRYEGPNRVHVDLPQGHAGGVLFLSDTWAQGWRANCGDRGEPVRKALGAFRLVQVQPGDRRVDFTYCPAAFWIGLALSGLGLALLGWLAFRARRIARRNHDRAGPGDN